MSFDIEPEKIDFSFTVRVGTADIEASAEMVARYNMPAEREAPTEDTVVAFANRVAFFAAYPFLREVVRSTTARLPGGAPVVLPVVQDPPGFAKLEP